MTSSVPLDDPSADALPQLPRVFGRYVLFDRIGRGGMADIFLARADTAFGGSRLCVLKQILPRFSHDSGFERMLISEAKLAAQLSHTNIAQVFDLGRESDRLFIAMEYVEGFDLNQLLRALSEARLGLPAEFALLIIRDVLRGLDYAHRAKDRHGRALGLVHRDVSPSNVLISFEGEVKLCDFGIAKALNARDERLAAAQSNAPRVVGKSAYMAPEHAMGDVIDARADLFSAGILLWELCAGKRLYRGTEEQMLALARQAEIPPLPDRGLPNLPLLQAVLDRALARRLDERFSSAQQFLVELEDYAVQSRLMGSQLRFGAFLTDHFGARILELRRERERAARSVPSNLPPPNREPDPSSDQVETVVADTASLLAESDSQMLASEEPAKGWSEPGATVGRAPGHQGPSVVPSHLPGNALSDDEVSNSLLGLDALAARASVAPRSIAPSVPPSAVQSLPPPALSQHPEQHREWLWYAAAIAILGLGLAGYFWR
ncbi:MAG TPA: serine/threonine-protein kinase [Polyangiales bacterium]